HRAGVHHSRHDDRLPDCDAGAGEHFRAGIAVRIFGLLRTVAAAGRGAVLAVVDEVGRLCGHALGDFRRDRYRDVSGILPAARDIFRLADAHRDRHARLWLPAGCADDLDLRAANVDGLACNAEACAEHDLALL